MSETKSVKRDKYGFAADPIAESLTSFQKYYSKLLKDREELWTDELLNNIDTYSNSEEWKQLVRNGIPNHLRRQIWKRMCGCESRMKESQGVYAEFVAQIPTSPPSSAFNQIEKDLRRTFPTHELFYCTDEVVDPETIHALRRLLKAYALKNPEVGYCQSMNFIGGMLLLFMKDEEEAFWMLSTIIEQLLPSNFFTAHMLSLQVDQGVLASLVDLTLPDLSRFFQQNNIPFQLISTQWLLCIFVNTVPVETTIRIWDIFFNEGSIVLFRIALAILNLSKDSLIRCAELNDNASPLNVIKVIAKHAYNPDVLIWVAFHDPMISTVSMAQINRMRISHAGPIRGLLEESEARRKMLEKKFTRK